MRAISASEALWERAREVIPLVGREAELARLRGALDDTWDGRGRAVAITGDAGKGRDRRPLAFWQPSLTCSLDNPLEFLAEGWIVGSS